MKTLALVYFNAGGGHRAAAMALQQVFAEQQRPWSVQLVNLLEVLDPNDTFQKATGMAPEEIYNRRLARGWTLGLAQELRLLQVGIRLGHRMLLRRLQTHWLESEPDLVVSLVPNFNRALFESVTSRLPGVPFVTVMTDMADHPPHFWIEPGQSQHLVCGTHRAELQALAAGYSRQQVSRTSGMILRPDFYRVPAVDREAELRALGLDPARPIGIVLFGGQGSRQMLRIARLLRDEQLILMCGHNLVLAKKLQTLSMSSRHVIVGFTPDVARYMHLASYFVGKPGPGCLSEATRMGLPVVTFENRWTMPQERYNAQWVRENAIGTVLKSAADLPQAVADLCRNLSTLRANVRRIDNQAVFEVPEILDRLLKGPQSPEPQLAGMRTARPVPA